MTLTPLRRRGAALAAALLSAALVLTACGSGSGAGTGGATGSTDASSGSAAGFPVTIPSDFGEIKLTEKPEKIVVVGANRYVDVLAALDEAPAVFGSGVDEQTTLTWTPWIKGKYGQYVSGLLTADWTPDAEAIGAQDPDLIVLQDNGAVDESLHKKLSAIAPVYTENNPRNWADAVTNMGAATGRSERAKEVISEVEADFSAARGALRACRARPTSRAGSTIRTAASGPSPRWAPSSMNWG